MQTPMTPVREPERRIVEIASGIVQTARGPLNLRTGPFTGLQGMVPTNASQLNAPLFFSSADVPRQIQFGLKLAF